PKGPDGDNPCRRPAPQETPVGVEPTSEVLQTPPSPSGSSVQLYRGVHTPARRFLSVLARNRTWSATSAKSRASITPRGRSILARSRTGSRILGESCAIPYTTRTLRADDWVRTSILRLTRSAPFCYRATSA